ncbi:MAG: penicillin-binding transpeptidase domain-containing protein, partial [Bacillota bacterium]|nr:penicillin-binding transpeptidase domain-containing protein [Bacillota bacterium]
SQVSSKDHDLAASIGGFTAGMSPLEMTAAYSTFGTDGVYTPSHAIVDVTDRHGRILYTWGDRGKRIWSTETVDKIRYLMKKTVAEGTAKKAFIPSGYVGGKTGTTNDYKDYWFIGLTDNLTIGVWVGKDKPESMEYFEKKGPQLLIWRDIARK